MQGKFGVGFLMIELWNETRRTRDIWASEANHLRCSYTQQPMREAAASAVLPTVPTRGADVDPRLSCGKTV
jgi:hypothetical protein